MLSPPLTGLRRQVPALTSFDSALISQSSLVTCSGAYKTGSLRVVKRGVGLNEMAALEVPGVQKLWSFQAYDGYVPVRSLSPSDSGRMLISRPSNFGQVSSARARLLRRYSRPTRHASDALR